MTLSPKKYISNYTSSTTNRGVEAKEIELANTRLDVRASSPAPRAAPAPDAAAVVHDDTASYIQVEVRRARLPAASSPAPPAPSPPPPAAGDRWRGGDGAAPGDEPPPPAADDASENKHGLSVWKNYADYSDEIDEEGTSAAPERVEVYYFERSAGAYLATSAGAGGGRGGRARLEVWARGAGRRGAALLREACAAPALAGAAGVAVLVAAERAALLLARAALVGGVQTAADYALKPALTLVFNAALHPPLVFAGNVLRALRATLRPLWAALGDALEPAARLLAAVRLVHVTVDRRSCACAPTQHAPPHSV